MKKLLIACMLMMVGCGGATGEDVQTPSANQSNPGEFPDISGTYRLATGKHPLCDDAEIADVYHVSQDGNLITITDAITGEEESFAACFYDIKGCSFPNIPSSIEYVAHLYGANFVEIYIDHGFKKWFGPLDQAISESCIMLYQKDGGQQCNCSGFTRMGFSNEWSQDFDPNESCSSIYHYCSGSEEG